MELSKKTLKLEFINKWPIALVISLTLIVASVWVWVDQGESKYGVDFRGGHEFLVKAPSSASSESIRKALEDTGINDATVQSFEIGSNQYSIRLGGEATEGGSAEDRSKVMRAKVLGALSQSLGNEVEILRTDYVGPTVGRELRMKALWATIIGLVGILLYLTYRFEFAFALGAVVAIFHDVIITTGAYLFAGYALNMSTIAAALTILGYSVHDTIVILDRVREEIFKREDFNLSDLFNECINATMSRTIITMLLTQFSIIALLIFGGGGISDLAFYLFIGMIAGTYSTIYVTAPVVLGWDWLRNRKARSAQTA